MEEKLDRIWKHTITPGLCGILCKVGEAVYLKGVNKIHMQKDLSLSNTEFANYSKLRLFGLLAHYRENGEIQRGYWLLTHNGALFLRNKLAINKTVHSLNNELVERSIEEVRISDIWKDYTGEKWQQFFPWEPVPKPTTEESAGRQFTFAGI